MRQTQAVDSRSIIKATHPSIESKPKRNGEISFAATFMLGGIAAITAELITYPLDVLKTRLQVTKHLKPLQITHTLFLQEGRGALVLGLDAACTRHIFYSGIRIMLYELLRDKTPIGRNIDGSFPMYRSAICALLSGGVAQFIASPTDFVKVQMQVEGLRVIMGKERVYKNTLDCLTALYRQYGFSGLWNGCIPNVQRGALIQIGDLCAYDTVKHAILKHRNIEDNWILHGISSIISGLISTIMCNPCDVVKTRMMNNPNEFRGTLHCFTFIIAHERPINLYKGFFPIWARLGPWSVIFYLTFEKLRNVSGLKSF